MSLSSPFDLSPADLLVLLDPAAPLFPELEAARADPGALRAMPQTAKTLAWTEAHIGKLAQIPVTRYTDYRAFIRTGDREAYETPYFARRAMLAGAALRLFMGETALKDPLQDLIWAICEETSWVLPAHERAAIDLFSAETGFMLAEALALLGDRLDAEVRSRVRLEVERRIFQPYLVNFDSLWWYKGRNNWNGVCNSSVAAAFLLLEPEPGRVAQALALALRGLKTFFATAFESDGSSTEGVSYWNYGLINFVALAEMLRARTRGRLDLLDSDHFRKIAAYPAKLLLSPSRFASFSDCDDRLNFNPGMITRLMERTGEASLQALLSSPIPSERQWRLTMMLRDLLWWDGQYQQVMPQSDAYLPVGQVARLVARTPKGAPVSLAIKAGHNDENHNQNDVGSFILHVGEESFLVDPGRGLYTRQYFGPERYQNIFANSFAHSLPVIGGQGQKEGAQFSGKMVEVQARAEGAAEEKWAEVEIAGAYLVSGLASLRRRVSLSAEGIFTLQDTFRFADEPHGSAPLPVEAVLVTWNEVETGGASATLRGAEHDLRLTIQSPAGACFQVQRLEQESRENHKPGVLKRLTIQLPPAREMVVRVTAEVVR